MQEINSNSENNESDENNSNELILEIPRETDIQDISKSSYNGVSLTPLQKAGVGILYNVGIVASVIIILIFVVSFGTRQKVALTAPPTPPSPPDQNQQDQAKTEIYQKSMDQYERLVKLTNQNIKAQEEMAINLFQQFIITGILPTFTAILGYIFGSRTNNNE